MIDLNVTLSQLLTDLTTCLEKSSYARMVLPAPAEKVSISQNRRAYRQSERTDPRTPQSSFDSAQPLLEPLMPQQPLPSPLLSLGKYIVLFGPKIQRSEPCQKVAALFILKPRLLAYQNTLAAIQSRKELKFAIFKVLTVL